jgi:hypothetical protein
VYVGQHLSFTHNGQTTEEEEGQGQNRTRENPSSLGLSPGSLSPRIKEAKGRPSGIEEGACGNVGYGSQAEAHRETWWMSH